MNDKSKLELIGEITQANNKNLELIQEINNLQSKIEKAFKLLQLLHYKFKDGDSIHNEIEDIQNVLKEDK